jgi:Oxidoreductase family, NAD-binding Rossmann fold
MEMIRIGLVDLDTSHPKAFTRILRTFGDVEVTAVFDSRDVWPEGYDRRFASEQNIPTICTRLDDMPDHVDAAMIHGVNWNTHIEKALPFMKAGKPVLIDKPVVGSVRDADRLLDLQARYGSVVYGGSSLRYAREITALKQELGGREHLVSVLASGPGDFFSYGIHTTEMLQGCIGTGLRSVAVIADRPSPMLALRYDDGFVAVVQLQMPYHEWSLCVFTEQGGRMITVNADSLYEPFLRNFTALIRGEHVDYSLAGPVEAVQVHIAARIALDRGMEIMLVDLPAAGGFDGSTFAAEYRAAKTQEHVS